MNVHVDEEENEQEDPRNLKAYSFHRVKIFLEKVDCNFKK